MNFVQLDLVLVGWLEGKCFWWNHECWWCHPSSTTYWSFFYSTSFHPFCCIGKLQRKTNNRTTTMMLSDPYWCGGGKGLKWMGRSWGHRNSSNITTITEWQTLTMGILLPRRSNDLNSSLQSSSPHACSTLHLSPLWKCKVDSQWGCSAYFKSTKKCCFW
jgi:hypothetical protein